jgi:hypothetical protein
MSEDHCTSGNVPKPPFADGPPYAMGVPPLERSREWGSVLCREPTEYPESYQGITLCPVCEWQEAQRTACSG